MKIINGYGLYCEDKIKNFVSTSVTNKKGDLEIGKGEVERGWVDFYFRTQGKIFTVSNTLAANNLSDIVMFFESLIDLDDEVVVFLDDECISVPMLYASPIDDEHIRMIIADGKVINEKCRNNELDEEPQLSDYEIRCDVIVNKKWLLRDFWRTVNQILDDYSKIEDENEIFTINYDIWEKNFLRIVNYVVR